MPVLDEATTTEPVRGTAVTKRVGAYWKIDYGRDLHVFTTSTERAGSITSSQPRTMADIQQLTDLSQVRTRVFSEGGGANALVDVAVGSTTIPVETNVWYSAAGGVVVAGPQRLTYTGKSALDSRGSVVAGRLLSPGGPSAAIVANVAGALSVGTRSYKTSVVTPDGESELSGASPAVTIIGVTAPGALTAAVVSGASGDLSSGARYYLVTFVTAAGETTAGVGSGPTTIAAVSAPSAATTAAVVRAAPLARSPGTQCLVTYVTTDGENDQRTGLRTDDDTRSAHHPAAIATTVVGNATTGTLPRDTVLSRHVCDPAGGTNAGPPSGRRRSPTWIPPS